MKKVIRNISLKLIFNIYKFCITPTMIYHLYLKRLPEKMKLKKVEKLAANLQDNTEYFIHIRNLK